MKNLMVLVAFLVVALVAAPAIAQDGESTTPPPPIGEAPKDPPSEASQEPLPKVEDPVSDAGDVTSTDTGDDSTSTATGSVEDVSDDGTSTRPGPGDVTSTDTGDDTDAAEDTNDDTVEDTADADDNVTKDEIVDIDDVVDEDREDQKAGKKDKDDDDEDREDQKADKKDKDDDEDDNEDKDGVEQSGDQDADSGDVDQDANVINTGDNVNQCVAILQVANTGNAQNANQIAQSDSEAGEIELEDGSTINITPRLILECRQVIRQVVKSERLKDSDAKKLRTLLQPRGGAPIVRTGGVPNRVGGVPNRVAAGAVVPTSRLGAAAAPKVLSASRAGQPKASTLRSLPRTGGFSGYATLLGLGTGALLIGGGLLVRRVAR